MADGWIDITPETDLAWSDLEAGPALAEVIAATDPEVLPGSARVSFLAACDRMNSWIQARTGIAAMVTGALFLVAMFFTPLVSIVPWEAAAPALVVVGAMMMMQVRKIDFTDLAIGIPAFLTIVLMPFTYSIVNGIGAGFVSWVVIKACQRRFSEIPVVMWVVAVAFVIYFAADPISGWLGL